MLTRNRDIRCWLSQLKRHRNGEVIVESYRNPWHKGGKGYGPAVYDPDRKVTSHCGFDIYYRAGCFDVVQSGACHTQMAGINGAKRWCEENEFKLVA